MWSVEHYATRLGVAAALAGALGALACSDATRPEYDVSPSLVDDVVDDVLNDDVLTGDLTVKTSTTGSDLDEIGRAHV